MMGIWWDIAILNGFSTLFYGKHMYPCNYMTTYAHTCMLLDRKSCYVLTGAICTNPMPHQLVAA